MKRKTLFFLLGCVFCSLGTAAQTYKLSEMSEAEFKQGFNSYFRFDQYRLASGVYTPFTIYTDSGRVNFFDRWWPERFQGEFIGGQVNEVAGNRDYTTPLIGSWTAKKTAVDATVVDNDPASFIYVARINQNTYETYPTAIGQAAISFIAPSEGYYRITADLMRMDQMETGTPEYLMAKFRFRQQGTPVVFSTSTLGIDCKYGDMAEEGLEIYTAPSGVDFSGAERTYTKTKPVTNEFYVYVKAGDMITAESDIAHLYEQGVIADSASYGARAAWGRTRWTQFEAELVTKETAEASNRFVDPYSDNDNYINLFKTLFTECVSFMDTAIPGLEIGQFDQSDIDEFWNILENNGKEASNPNLLGYTAKVYYQRLSDEFETFKSKAAAIDYQLPENRWLFVIPESSSLYADFEKQFLPGDDPGKAENSPWDFKMYNVSSGAYESWPTYGAGSLAGDVDAFYTNASTWFFIAKNGAVHPTTTMSPAITFTAATDGLYHASTTIQRDPNNKNNNYMHTRYRFAQGGIQNTTTIRKDNFMFADAYGNPSNNTAVSRDFYVMMKAGDAITFEEDAYTANAMGSAGSYWQKLAVVKVAEEKVEETISANKENYFSAYEKAGDYTAIDSIVHAVESSLSTLEFTDDETELGKYPTAARWEIDDILETAKEVHMNPDLTQVEVDKIALELSEAYKNLLSSVIIRYEKEETLASGAYYIEKDGLFVTTNLGTLSGSSDAGMYAHLEPIYEFTGVENNQVFDIQFNENQGAEDPARYTLQCCLINDTWTDTDPLYHITEKGEIREGDKFTAQSTLNSNMTWRNHSLIYNGNRWCIYNVHTLTSLVFNADLSAKPAMDAEKLYLYRLIPMSEIGTYLSVTEINQEKTNAQISAITSENGVELYSTREMEAVVYNAAGHPIATIQLDGSPKQLTLPSGFYLVKAVNCNAITRFIIK